MDYHSVGWSQRVRALPEDMLEMLKGEDRFVHINNPEQVWNTEMMFGVPRGIEPEFWDTMHEACTECVRVVSVFNMEKGEKGTIVVVRSLQRPQGGFWNIPGECVGRASDDVVTAVLERVRLEAERQALIDSITKNLPKNAYRVLTQGKRNAEELLHNVPSIAAIAYGNVLDQAPVFHRNSIEKLLKDWDVVQVSPSDDVLLRCVKKNVVLKYHTENTGRVHLSLDSASVDMGTYVVDAGIHTHTVLQGLTQQTLLVKIFGTMHQDMPFIHPHIAYNDGEGYITYEGQTLHLGNPCWGSYLPAVNKHCEQGELLDVMSIVMDYLTSCSETGWYRSMAYWLPEATQKKYCDCGKLLWEACEDEECSACHSHYEEEENDDEDTDPTAE